MEKYDCYKDSGVERIGEIPKHWEIRKIKSLGNIKNGSTPTSSFKDYWDGEIVWVTPKDINGTKYISDSDRKITEKGYMNCGVQFVDKGSIVITSRAPIGKISIANTQLCTNQGCKSVEFKSNDINNIFLYYFLRNSSAVLNSLGTGTTFMELSTIALKNVEVPLPPLPEQQKIAAFLDDKTEKIDHAIHIKEREINLLKERRQILIQQAVTKGINPNVMMKDSGVEFIGDIPAHWEVRKLKFIGEVVLGKMICNEEKRGYFLKPYLKSKNIQWMELMLDSVDEMWFSENELKQYRLKQNDLVVSEGGEVGKTCIWNEELEECYIQNSAHKITLKENNSAKYYLYVFFTFGKNGLFESIVNRVSIGHLTREKLTDIYFPKPPVNEQTKIVNYLEQAEEKIQKAISLKEQEIEKLKEYKTVLIDNVVTGKVRVV